MFEAVRAARDLVEPGGAVVLSPACASFDEFDNFVHRGLVFADLANDRLPTPSAKQAAVTKTAAETAVKLTMKTGGDGEDQTATAARTTMANRIGRFADAIASAYPAWVLLGCAAAAIRPETFLPLQPYLELGLGGIMLAMGLTLTPSDLAAVLRRPGPAVLGVALQYTIMPLLGAVAAAAAVAYGGLPSEAAAGIILVSCCPGGTASNVVTHVVRAVAFASVTSFGDSAHCSPRASEGGARCDVLVCYVYSE
jgi:BASS family bile acid:Na+ symporter